ncbi:hypothetical protein DITRI_Ditri05aG0059500 [Diplodiscus trichospermus]
MAASRLGGSFLKYVYHSSNPYNKNPGQLFFFRGFASTLFVKGISFSTTEEGLANSFSEFGKVLEAKVVTDKVRNRSKGYGFVTFAEEAEATKALTVMNGKLLDGRVIFVDKVRPRSLPRTPSQAASLFQCSSKSACLTQVMASEENLRRYDMIMYIETLKTTDSDDQEAPLPNERTRSRLSDRITDIVSYKPPELC